MVLDEQKRILFRAILNVICDNGKQILMSSDIKYDITTLKSDENHNDTKFFRP